MTWTQIALTLAALISTNIPAQCQTPWAADFAIKMDCAEGCYQVGDLPHQLMMGSFITKGCTPDRNYYSSYQYALMGWSQRARDIYFGTGINAERLSYLSAIWYETVNHQYYRIRHFAKWLPQSWCGDIAPMSIGDMQYC